MTSVTVFVHFIPIEEEKNLYSDLLLHLNLALGHMGYWPRERWMKSINQGQVLGLLEELQSPTKVLGHFHLCMVFVQ